MLPDEPLQHVLQRQPLPIDLLTVEYFPQLPEVGGSSVLTTLTHIEVTHVAWHGSQFTCNPLHMTKSMCLKDSWLRGLR